MSRRNVQVKAAIKPVPREWTSAHREGYRIGYRNGRYSARLKIRKLEHKIAFRDKWIADLLVMTEPIQKEDSDAT